MGHAQRSLDLEQISGEGLISSPVHLLGHPGDPRHQLVEGGHGTGEHGALIVHRPSLAEPSRRRARPGSTRDDGNLARGDPEEHTERPGRWTPQRRRRPRRGVDKATLGGGSQYVSPGWVAGPSESHRSAPEGSETSKRQKWSERRRRHRSHIGQRAPHINQALGSRPRLRRRRTGRNRRGRRSHSGESGPDRRVARAGSAGG